MGIRIVDYILQLDNGSFLTTPSLSRNVREGRFGKVHQEIFLRYLVSRYSWNSMLPREIKVGDSFVPLPREVVDAHNRQSIVSLQTAHKRMLLDAFPPRSGDVILEIGAFYGLGTVRLSELVSDGGLVVAVEVDSIPFQVLKMNVALNGISNVVAVNKGLWDKNEMLPLFVSGDQRSSLRKAFCAHSKWPREVEVEVDTGDCLLERLGVSWVDLIIIEANGSEARILEGLHETLGQEKLRLVVQTGDPALDNRKIQDRVLRLLREHGFVPFVASENRVYAIKGVWEVDNDD